MDVLATNTRDIFVLTPNGHISGSSSHRTVTGGGADGGFYSLLKYSFITTGTLQYIAIPDVYRGYQAVGIGSYSGNP